MPLDGDCQLNRIVWRVNQILLGIEVSLNRLNRRVAKTQLDRYKFASPGAAQLGACAAEVIGRDTRNAGNLCITFELPDDFLRQTGPSRFAGRNTRPSASAVAVVQASIATFTQFGIGAFRTRPCLSMRSTMHQ